ncbi:MAG: carboxylesterase/lipase family protein [Candidatus Acidiferrales bacterium]
MLRVITIYTVAWALVSGSAAYVAAESGADVPAPGTIIHTESGWVQGVVQRNLIAFRGIPYAAPPVGNLRWRPPRPPVRWKGIRDASRFGHVCAQINYNGQYAGSEDCLTLNVYMSRTTTSRRQPVMVFFHGGGDIAGDGQAPPFNLPPLANHGVVVVTAEYRLGILGFLAHPLLTAEGGGASGNYGSLDQIAVLHWVQRNIRAFGGDPHHVMAFGQSAGSYDMQALLAAPSAQGLFSVAGMESGALPAGLFFPLSDLEAASAPFVAYFGCNTVADVLACLRKIAVRKIVDYLSQNPSFINSLGPGVAPPFLPEDPFLVFQQSGSPVPLLIGSTREESTGWEGIPNPNLTPDEYAVEIHQEFDPVGAGVADEVLALYPATDYDSPAYALIAVHSDYWMSCAVRNVARAAAGAGRPPVWRYLYTHRFENDASLNAYRAFHAAELYFLFGNLHLISPPFLGVIYTPSAAERQFSTDLMGYWTRFAATGDPNGASATPWPAYDASSDSMLQLDDTFAMINGYHNPQCDYFSTLPFP